MKDALPHSSDSPPTAAISPDDIRAVRAAVARIVQSSDFAGSARLRQLLEYIVDAHLVGETHRLKGYTLAIDVFGRDASFDPRLDPIVRVEIGRLRKALAHYYFTHGSAELIRISIPKGGVAPQIDMSAVKRVASPAANLEFEPPAPETALADGPLLAILPIEWGEVADVYQPLLRGIPETLALTFSTHSTLRVIPSETLGLLPDWEANLLAVIARLQVHLVLRVSARTAGSRLRLNAQLVSTADGVQLWAGRIDTDLADADPFDIEDAVAAELLSLLLHDPGTINRCFAPLASAGDSQSLSAYAALFSYAEYVRDGSAAARDKAFKVLGCAAERFPDDPRPFAFLAILCAEDKLFGRGTDTDDEMVIAAAARAVRLAPDRLTSQMAMATAHFSRGEYGHAIWLLDYMLAARPTMPLQVKASIGCMLAHCGQWARGVSIVREAEAQMPTIVWFTRLTLALDELRAGRFPEAISCVASQRMALPYWALLLESMCHCRLGQADAAMRKWQQLADCRPDIAERPMDIVRCLVHDPILLATIEQTVALLQARHQVHSV